MSIIQDIRDKYAKVAVVAIALALISPEKYNKQKPICGARAILPK